MTHRRHIAVLLVLLACARDRHEEHDDPGDAHFEPHLEVDRADARVKTRAHEDVVDEVAGHANLVPSRDSKEVHAEGDAEAIDHSDRHEVPEVVDDLSHAEDARSVQDGSSDHSDVDAAVRVALVHEGLVAEGRDRQTFLHVARYHPCEEELIDDEASVDLPRVRIRARVLVTA